MIKRYLDKTLNADQKRKAKRMYASFYSSLFPYDLNKLAELHGTDKIGAHFYMQHYHAHFKRSKNKKLNLLEIGIGGFVGAGDYSRSNIGGSSLRMWKDYFKKAQIIGLDIEDKTPLAEKRITIYKGSQTDPIILKEIVDDFKCLDIIIDDGSHINEHVIETFKILFPLLSSNGIYVIEDTQTSYWPSYGGDSTDLENRNTLMNFFKSFIDSLNYEEFIKPGYIPSIYDMNIIAIHFYHNLIFIQKGANEEGSTWLTKNTIP